jgi:hypothetical protein
MVVLAMADPRDGVHERDRLVVVLKLERLSSLVGDLSASLPAQRIWQLLWTGFSSIEAIRASLSFLMSTQREPLGGRLPVDQIRFVSYSYQPCYLLLANHSASRFSVSTR